VNKIFAVLGVIILLLIVIIIIPHNTVSNTAINTYLITLKNVPEGKGMYQQLININLSYPYGINSNGSNILFKDGSNNTFLYAWIQSINATNLQLWIKNYNNSILIEMLILPSFENLFSATGYLGEAPQLSSVYGNYDNGKKVFNFYTNWANKTFNGSGTYLQHGNTNQSIFNDGVIIWSNLSVGSVAMETTANYNLSNFVVMTDISLSVNGSQNSYLIGEQNSYGQFLTSVNGPSNYFTFALYTVNSSGYANVYGNTVNGDNPFIISLWQKSNIYYASFQNNTFSQTLSKSRNFSTTSGVNYFDNPLFFSIGASLYINETQHYYWLADRTVLSNGMPTFTISPIGTAPNPLYFSNSFTISNILLMDEKVKL
jgi:hypothetical protein